MLRGGGVAQESAVPRQFRNRHSSGEGDDMDMEVDEETAAAAPAQADADGHESESDAEKSDGEESKTKVRRMLISWECAYVKTNHTYIIYRYHICISYIVVQKLWKVLGEDKARVQSKKPVPAGDKNKKEKKGEAPAEESAVEPETNLNAGGVAAALLYASKKGYIKSDSTKSAAEPPPRKQIEEILSKDFLVEDKKFECVLLILTATVVFPQSVTLIRVPSNISDMCIHNNTLKSWLLLCFQWHRRQVLQTRWARALLARAPLRLPWEGRL